MEFVAPFYPLKLKMDESGIIISSLTSLLRHYKLCTKLNAQISGSIIKIRTFILFLLFYINRSLDKVPYKERIIKYENINIVFIIRMSNIY